MGYDGSLKFDTAIAEQGFATGIKNIGNIAKGGLKILGTAVAGTVAAFGVLTKKSLDSVASLEQNIGGVETLFKDSAQTVIDNANKAYKTAGMSANAYMQNVTSFSASLLQSLAGDTAKVAQVADTAMVDMSDNVNKMGSDMEAIQNAYQGFAKQNYTMLDNLKLGYGGTKKEMERLLSDAEKIQAANGKMADYSIDSFADIIEAIHVVQEEMGITGTTAEEAATTIEGSMNMAKAAFDNFLNGSGSAQELADSIATAAGNIAKNLGEIIPRLASSLAEVGKLLMADLSEAISGNASQIISSGAEIISNLTMGIIQAIPGIFSAALQVINAFITNISARIPQILSVGAQILTNLINGMIQLLPSIVAFALTLISQLYNAFTAAAPGLLQKGYEILNNLITGFVQAIPEVLPKVLDFIQGIGDKLAEAAPILIQKGFELLSKFAEGITSALPILIAKVPQIITTFANVINNNFPRILKKGIELLGQLALGILQAVPTLISHIPDIVQAIVAVFTAYNWMALGKNIITFLKNGISSMISAVKSAATNVQNGIINSIKNLPNTLSNLGKNAISKLASAISSGISNVIGKAKSIVTGIKGVFTSFNWGSIGSNIIKGIANGIAGAVGGLVNAAINAAKSAFNAAKNALGIHSPSKLFKEKIGKMMALGMGIGFEENVPVKDMNKSIGNSVKKMQKSAASVLTRTPVTTSNTVKNVTNNYTGTSINYKEIEKAQENAMNKANERPIILNGRQVNRGLKDGGVVFA